VIFSVLTSTKHVFLCFSALIISDGDERGEEEHETEHEKRKRSVS